MRDITDKRNNISELQKYLRELHYSDYGNIPLVNPDGIYGPETTNAVRAFQSEAGLPVTGRTDNTTWNEIYKAYLSAYENRATPKPIFPFPAKQGYEITSGERSDIVSIIQLMLRLLAELYDDIDGTASDGLYGDSTVSDVRNFQKHSTLPVTGRVDKATWNALADAYNSAVKIEN